MRGSSICLALPSEKLELERLQMRPSLANEGDRDAFSLILDAIQVPVEQIAGGRVFVSECSPPPLLASQLLDVIIALLHTRLHVNNLYKLLASRHREIACSVSPAFSMSSANPRMALARSRVGVSLCVR